MTDPQADHAAIFGAVARQMMQAAAEFAQGIQPALTTTDAARIYLAAGVHLSLRDNSPATVTAMLRELAGRLEAGAPVVN